MEATEEKKKRKTTQGISYELKYARSVILSSARWFEKGKRGAGSLDVEENRAVKAYAC